ncbi:5'-nucleotidase, lipoprotein e(P4) family [Fulvivirga sp. RKSG066]|nr:5'-nucleotidase, lipoprotein e(P4) family [Fulvivirga aurantia]
MLTALAACQQTAKQEKTDYEAEIAKELGGAVLWYQTSAEMHLSYLQAYRYAQLLLDEKLSQGEVENPAVVLDIDETVLDNSPYQGRLLEEGKLYASESWMDWTKRGKAKALPGVKKFVVYAKEKGVEVIYISNRSVKVLGPTIQNLKDEGFPNADSAYVFLKEETSDKTNRRATVSDDYNILVFVGDNLTDYSQLYADRDEDWGKQLVEKNKEELLNNFVMLPNPMYGEWEGAVYRHDYKQPDSVKLEMRKEALNSY